ncbi:hypothetical protein [Halomicrobium katesii]|uniref:hypothetical protein n=1 Tax=Halomicrobium katesii TaxID=437163 RepID=UPI00035EFCF0|nr:hypothetical protein [Halomicrobium katesii]
MDDREQSVEAVVDYCRTQARLLSGQSERLSAEIDDLLDEIDTEAAAVRDRLASGREQADSPDQPAGPGEAVDETTVAELEAKQSTVADKQERLDEIGTLAAAYVHLASSLQAESDATEAIRRVLELEADADAPAFFEERETLLETATDQ